MARMHGFISGPLLAVLIIVGGFLVTMGLMRLSTPPEIVFLTGPEGSTFHEQGLHYKEILARDGVTVHIEETLGTVENVTLLLQAEVPTAAFGEGVHALEEESTVDLEGISSLGALYLQPLWVFRLKDGMAIDDLENLEGRRIASGWKGSSARMLALLFLDDTGTDDEVELAPLGDGQELTANTALEALQARKVVAVIATGQPDSPLIDGLLRAPELEVVSLKRAEAIVLQFPFLREVRLPEGAYDLAENIPPQDLSLLAAGTELLVSDQFPAALTDLLVAAAAEIHGEPTLFSERDEFPDPQMVSLPLNMSAELYYRDGPPALRKILPFRWATLIDRFSKVVVAFGSLAIALFGVLPKLLTGMFERNMGNIYRSMEAIEKSLAGNPDRKALLDELDELDKTSNEMKVPLKALIGPWMEQRQNLYDLRERVSG